MKRFCQFILPALLVSLASQTAQAQQMLTIKGERVILAGGVVSFEFEVLKDVTDLDFSSSQLMFLTLPEGLENLETLNLGYNRLTTFSLPEGLTNLKTLELINNGLLSLTLPGDLTNLETLNLEGNNLQFLNLPEGLANLKTLNLARNRLTSLTLSKGLTNLATLNLTGNRLKFLTIPEGLPKLETLDIRSHRVSLSSLVVREDLAERIRNGDVSLIGFNSGDVTIYTPPSLSISRMDGIMEITWNGGVLQSTTDLFGEWQDLESAESPLRILFPSEAMRFFRLRL